MGSVYELNSREEYNRIRKQEHRLGWILLELAANKPSLDKQIDFDEHTETKVDFVGKVGDLEKYLWYYGTPDNPELWSELYLEKYQQRHIISYNECRVGRFPVCSHKFIDGGLIYKISYDQAAFFSQWRQQQQRAIDFLRSFETISSNQQQHGG